MISCLPSEAGTISFSKGRFGWPFVRVSAVTVHSFLSLSNNLSNSFNGENAEYEETGKQAERPTHFTCPFSITIIVSAEVIACTIKKHKISDSHDLKLLLARQLSVQLPE